MKKWQKALSLLVGFGLTFGLAACGSDDSSSSGPKKQSNRLVEGEKIAVSFEKRDTATYTFTPEREDNYIFMAYAGEIEDMISGDAGEMYMYLYDEDEEEVGQYAFGKSDCGNPIAIAGDLEEGEKYTLELISEDVTECSLFVLGEERQDELEDILGEEFADIMGGGGAQRPSDSDDDESEDNSDSDGDESDSGNTDNTDNSDNSDNSGSDSDSDIEDPFDNVLDANVGESSSNTVEIETRGQKKVYRFETNYLNNSSWLFTHNASRAITVTVYDSNGVQVETVNIAANGTYLFTNFAANSYYYFEIGYQSTTRTGEFTFTIYSTTVPGSTMDSAIVANMGVNNVTVNLENGIYYVFTPTADGAYTFTSQRNDNDPRIELFDAGYCQIDSNDDGAGDLNFLLTRDLEAGQTYYIRVHLGGNTGTFSFEITAVILNGNNFGTAIEATIGTNDVSILASGENVYYVFRPTETATYEIYSDTSDCDPRGILYNANQTELVQSDDEGEGNNFFISYELTAGETYYIGTWAWETPTYQFVIEKVCQAGESFETAIEVSIGTYTVTLERPEYKYYVFRPTETGTYHIYSTAHSDTDAYLYDSNQNQLSYDDQGGNNGDFKISYELESGYTYYIKVGYYAGSSSGTFDFVIEKESVFASAIEVTEGQYQTDIETAGQVVYYKITNESPRDRVYVFYSSIYSTQYDTYGILYNAQGDEVQSNDDGGSEYRQYQITYTIWSGQTYYLASKMLSDSYTGTFYTNIEMQYEAGETFETAIEAEVGTYTVTLDYPEYKYYVFSPTETGTYHIYSTAHSDTEAYLYDSYKNQLSYNDQGGNNGDFKISYELESGYTYYIKVGYYAGGNWGTFDFVIEKESVFPSAIEASSGYYTTYIETAGQIVYFKITNNSSQDRTYIFYSSTYSTQYDTCAILYNAQGEQVASNDDGNGNLQYRISCTIGAGETYYLASKMLNDSYTGTFYTNIEYYTNY